MPSMINTLKRGAVLHSADERYEIVSVLGAGGFGVTYRAKVEIRHGNITIPGDVAIKEFFMPTICERDEDGRVVVNAMQKDKFMQGKKAFKKEADALCAMVANGGIVKVNEVFEGNGTCYYVMEYLGDTSLKKYVEEKKNLPERETLTVLRKIVNAVAFLHSQRRLHLDLKPANIMMVGGNPKIIDFGLSLQFDKRGKPCYKVQKACSDGYAPEEQYSGIDHFAPEVDIYALGAMTFFMLTGKAPLSASLLTDEYINEHLPHDISDATRALVKKCLAKEAKERFHCVEEILRVLHRDNDEGRELPDGDDVTLLIEEDTKSRKNYHGKILLGIVAGVAVGLVGLNLLLPQCMGTEKTIKKTRETDSVMTVEEKDTLAVDTVRKAPKEVKTGERKEEVKVTTEKKKRDKGAEYAVRTTTDAVHPKKVKGLNIGWGVWHGKVDANGTPAGFGTVDVKTTKQLRNGITAYKGDKIIDCELYLGNIYQGYLLRQEGGAPVEIPIQ